MGEHNSRAQIAETIHRVLGNFLPFSLNCYSFEINATWWLIRVKYDCFAKRFQSFTLCEMYCPSNFVLKLLKFQKVTSIMGHSISYGEE